MLRPRSIVQKSTTIIVISYKNSWIPLMKTISGNAPSEREVENEDNLESNKSHSGEEMPSRAMAIHEHIREHGEQELERDSMALLWSAVAAGLSMGASFLARGIFHANLEGIPGGFLLECLGYTFGFIIVIMARQQLFTENTLTVVLPVMQHPTANNFLLLGRLWGVVLVGNLAGTALAAMALAWLPAFDEPVQKAFTALAEEMMAFTAWEMFASGIVSGWLIATMVWMFPAAGSARILIIILITWLIAVANTTHIVVGSIEALYLILTSDTSWLKFLWPFALPTLAGNIVGGTFIFALISHAQIRGDMSQKK